jgi:hypothetical protein
MRLTSCWMPMRNALRTRLAELPDILTPTDLMNVLPIGRNGVYDALKANQITSRRSGQKIIITKIALVEFLGLAANGLQAGTPI